MKKLSLFILLLAVTVNAQMGIKMNGFGVELNQFGRVQIADDYPSINYIIYQSSILVATAPGSVFDFFQDAGNVDSVRALDSTIVSDTGLTVIIDNSYSNLLPKVLVKETLYGWHNAPYFLVKYTVTNTDSISVDALPGLEIVPRVAYYYGFDTVLYNFDYNYISFNKRNQRVGIKFLAEDSSKITSLTSINYFLNYNKDSSYYNWLNHDVIDTVFYADTNGAVTFVGQPDKILASGGSLTYFYAYTVANADSLIQQQLAAAETKFRHITVGVRDQYAVLPAKFNLYQNYPNPFNPSTIISFNLPKQQHVKLNIYNILGEKVAVILDDIKPAGTYKINFNGKNLASGIYFYELATDNMRMTKKMTLIK